MAANLGLMATAGYLIASAALRPDNVLMLWVPIVLVRFFGISRGAFRYVERLLSHDVTFRLLEKLRTRWFARLEPRFPLSVAEHRLGDLLECAVKDIDLLQNIFLRVLSPLVVAALTCAVSLTIVSHYGATYSLILGGCLALSGLLLSAIAYYQARHQAAAWVNQRSLLTSKIIDTVAGSAEILAFGREHDWLFDVDSHIAKVEKLERSSSRLDSLLNAIAIAMPGIAAWLMMVFGTRAVAHQQLSGVALTVLTLTALAAFESLQLLPSAFVHLGESTEAWKRLNQIVDVTKDVTKSDAHCPSSAKTKAIEATSSNRTTAFNRGAVALSIAVQDLTFGYAGQDENVLKDVTFRVAAGKSCAIVGSNGSGKSTLTHLIAGLYESTNGSIRVSDVDVNAWDKEQLRENMAVVSQSTYIFSATLLDNLRLGRASATVEDVKQVVQWVGLDHLVKRLDDGLLTWVGDGGVPLSGGERQRIGIARAVLRDAGLIILDEPTEGLDAESERAILTMLHRVFLGKTVLFITHRLMVLPEMDNIVVLDNGRVLEVGTHDQLVASRGFYAQLWQLGQDMLDDCKAI